MLSRLLSVAAAATAQSLMGGDARAVGEARSTGGDGEDGTFDGFLQALQSGRIASALRQSGSDGEDGAAGPSNGPLNFFRMFRFGSSTSDSRDTSTEANGSASLGSGQTEDDDGLDTRMVPIIIVGIRSISPGSGPGQGEDSMIPPFLEALQNFPTPISADALGNDSIDGILRRPHNSTRFSHRRRASMGGINTFPAAYEDQRHHRSPDRIRPWSPSSEASNWPRPPPTTPASPGLSALSSRVPTPTSTRPPSIASASGVLPSRRGSFIRRTSTTLETTAEETLPRTRTRTARQRRLSESDFTRFGAGSSRRNGVVEPDHTPSENSRSWIIYVLGGSYPENHPILTTPSLFTDSPTYEDMMLLSALLGPAKPPVASEQDVASAPGRYTIILRKNPGSDCSELASVLTAVADDGDDEILLVPEQRCLVCLCDFEQDEMARRLVKCGHLFHLECIDQWLTKGRNSCPLCRGQGVDEKEESSEAADTPSTESLRPELGSHPHTDEAAV
ncbi:hypothetical protein LTR66_004840 [Elasticomyces elasticus]|nr:hypothetical protein LTR50_000857 [Elasticomyces elasticus]KAK4995322.1 hypothetical protein LTR66_004840 [Elasticomyces elasticus]